MPPNATLAFLRCVLPAEGWYCAVSFDTATPRPGIDFPRQQFFATIEELAQAVVAHDAAGRTVYHACAAFKDPRAPHPRASDNARAARSLWLDIDCGPDKGYLDAPAAAEAVLAFCVRVGLPLPVLVGSGNGIHAYWPLSTELDPPSWQKLAMGLKSFCAKEGLIADRTRTADISSILRPVGTHNRKRGESRVTADERQFGSHDAGQFNVLLSQDPQSAVRRDRGAGDILSRIETVTAYAASYGEVIARRCAQVHALSVSGNLPEPRWYAILGVLARCEDGAHCAHGWSANDYPAYSAQETQSKLERARQLTGATTCAHLNDLNPGICEKCPHWGAINSPITLGEIEVEPEPVSDKDGPPEGLTVQELPRVPEPFSWTKYGQLCVSVEIGPDEHNIMLVSEYPIYLDSVQTGEIDGTNFSYKFLKFLPKHGWSSVTIDAATLHGSQGISTMFGRGAVIHDSKMFLQYARKAVDDYNKHTELETRYDQFGWKNGDTAFLYGPMLYTPAGPVEAIGAKEVSTRSQWLTPRKNANLIAWTEAADSLFSKGMEATSAVVLASFAAPLMRFQSADEGGAILHLFTPQSGHGKTTALQGAWTVWGTKEGLNLTNEDTRVSKPITLGTLGNLPVIYDELRDKDPETIRRFVVTFTEGRDRMRGMVDGSIRHTKSNWQTILLSAANNSLIELLEHDGTDAPAFRVLELSTELPKDIDKTQGDRLRKILNTNAGAAGDAYLRYLLHPPVLEWSKAALQQWTDEIWKVSGVGNAHRFRVRLVGAIAVAAALVNKVGILNFQTDRILQYLIGQIGSHQGIVTSRGSPLDQATSQLGEFINDSYSEILVVPDRFKPKQPKMIPIIKPHNKLTMRYEVATQRVFISESALKDWCLVKQISERLMVDLLHGAGIIIARKRLVTLSAGTDIPGAQVQCVELNAQHPVMSGLVAAVTELQGTINDPVYGRPVFSPRSDQQR